MHNLKRLVIYFLFIINTLFYFFNILRIIILIINFFFFLLLFIFLKVCRQLDGLSHFHFAPKPEIFELGVKSVPVSSISLEDILPTTQAVGTFSSSLAPEQVHQKKRGRDAAFISSTEADRDDRQRLRRAKKSIRNRNRKAEAAESGQPSQLSLKNDKRVVISKDTTENNNKSYSKSAVFFSEMQKNVENDKLHKNNKKNKNNVPQDSNKNSSNILKL